MLTEKKRELFLGYGAIIYAMYLFFILLNSYFGFSSERWRFFYYFTQQSNILSMIWFFLFGISAFCGKPLYHVVRNKTLMTAITVYMSITFFIVLFVLTPVTEGKWEPFADAGEFILHNGTTIMMWLYFFLVRGTGHSKVRACLYVLIYPMIYVVVNLIVGATTTYQNGKAAYAYAFISPDSYGSIGVYIGVIAGLILIFALFGLALIKLKVCVNRRYFDEK